MSFDRMKALLQSFKHGSGFKPDDVLTPRQDANPETHDVVDGTVVVLEQSPLNPSDYLVLGERQKPASPAERFVKFHINGHDWQRIGKA